MRRIKFPRSLLFSITLSALLLVLPGTQIASGETVRPTDDDTEAQIVWTTHSDKMYRVAFSHLDSGEWSSPVQVSQSDAYIFHPVSGRGSQGKKWIVWTKREEKGNFLQYSTTDASTWSPARQIKTGLRENRATTLIVDKRNTPWIAWEGANGGRSDVYWSRLYQGRWSAPEKIHADNTVPDIEPQLSLDSVGNISLSWQTVENAQYVTVLKKWNGKQWRTYSLQGLAKNERLVQNGAVIPYPEFIKEGSQARLYSKRNGRVNSTLLSNINF